MPKSPNRHAALTAGLLLASLTMALPVMAQKRTNPGTVVRPSTTKAGGNSGNRGKPIKTTTTTTTTTTTAVAATTTFGGVYP